VPASLAALLIYFLVIRFKTFSLYVAYHSPSCRLFPIATQQVLIICIDAHSLLLCSVEEVVQLLTDGADTATPSLHPNDQNTKQGTCTMTGGVSNLVVTMIGAGMLALPKAFSIVGIGAGLVLFAIVCQLTYFSTATVVR
jgi:hypothetical protein